MSVGENIKKIRKKRNMTQKQLAESSGLSRSYISDLESNKRNPSIKTIKGLAEKLEAPVIALIDDDFLKNEGVS